VSSLGITTDILRLKMPNQSNSLFRSAELKKPTETEVEYSLPSFIRKLLNSRLQDPPSLSEAANLCDISPATLKRKLKKHRTSYQKLIDECRFFKAVELMENQSYTRTDLAQYFCIQDSSNFQRSWKRWISQVN
jgi:AraC-like DNA-binding protein